MSYQVKKTLEVPYTDHEFELYIGGSHRSSGTTLTLKDGSTVTVSVKEIDKERSKNIDVNVNVDTEPFDQSVDNSVENLGELTGAVVGFKTASVAAKKASEQAIVGHVASGFLNMIEQNINLQNAGMEADMHALAGELKQQCDELAHKHDVMNKDFNRIKARYMDLFETINKEFKNRMLALIKPCFDFVNQIRKEQDRRAESGLLSMATTGGRESDSARIAIQASKMKRNAELLIDCSRRYIDDNRSLSRAVKAFSLNDGQSALFYAPVIIMTGLSENSVKEDTQVFLNPAIGADGKTAELVKLRQAELKDTNMSADTMSRVSEHFNKQLGVFDDGTVQTHRIAMQMKQLFEKNIMKTFA